MPDTGAPYFIPYVEPTDLVRDYPAANEAMALAIVAALEDIPVTIKKVDAFTGSGTFTVPAGVTYAIAHIRAGGGGTGRTGSPTAGGNSSVAFASGTVSALGGDRHLTGLFDSTQGTFPGRNNSGDGGKATYSLGGLGSTHSTGNPGALIVAGAAVTPAASITVTVGNGGNAGGGGSAGGSGYVYIEYFEEA